MRKIFLIASSLLFVTLTNAQVLTYEMVQNSTNPKKDLQKEYMEYTASDGHNYCVGQKITIGTPSSNKTFAYMTSELAIASAFMGGGKVDGIGATYAGSQMKIKSIKVERNKNRGVQVVFRCDLAGLGGVLVQIENCLSTGEIVSQGMTRDKALSEVKKANEMLELELITQQEFDSIKAECIKFIK